MLKFLQRYRSLLVWLLRVIVGVTFIFSGFSKVVDPWGFTYKITDYLQAWGIDWAPRGIIFTFSVVLSTFEFVGGLMLLLGCMRRIVVMALMALMCFMLPFSLYIWIFSPVADCGCFGEAWIIPNWATFFKNIIIVGFLIYLLPRNCIVKGLINPLYQWLPAISAVLYCLIVSLLGYMVQPIYDFRPYKTNSKILSSDDEDDDKEMTLIYEKDGNRKEFKIDSLPDSSWTFVERGKTGKFDDRTLTIYDDGEDVTDIAITNEGPQLLLLVSNPAYHNRARSSQANRLYHYLTKRNGNMIALLPLSGSNLDNWCKLAVPDYETYTVEDVVLKEIARGDAVLVYLENGLIKWKKNLYSFSSDFPEENENVNEMERQLPMDDGRILNKLNIALLFFILLACLIGHPKVKKRIDKISSSNNKSQ